MLVLAVQEPRMIDYGTGRPVRQVLVLVLVVREGNGLLLLMLSLPRTLVLLLAPMLLISLVLLALFLLDQHELECKPTLQAADEWGSTQVRVRSSAAACC